MAGAAESVTVRDSGGYRWLVDWSPEGCRRLAHASLDAGSNRWEHVCGVAAAAERIIAASRLSEVVVGAAWLHDVGYTTSVQQTGLHALDGARMIEALGAPADLVALVAYHSGAEYEAAERGLDAELRRYARPQQTSLDALTLADLTTGPTGARVSLPDRLAEILDRYPPTDPVHRAVLRSRDYLAACAARARSRAAVSP